VSEAEERSTLSSVALETTKADDIAVILEDEIVSGAIPPGTVLRQEQLSERFDVSRTPVREALRRLAALGLVTFIPNRGVRVRALSREELREAFLVRAELESLATELATPRMTPADLAALDAAEQRFGELTLELRRRTREGTAPTALFVDWMHANHAFHDVIYAAAASPMLERLAKSARRTLVGQAAWAGRAELDELYAKNDSQHRAIREAIAAGSASGARQLAREHVLSSGRLMETILDLVEAQQRGRRVSSV
jgi:DNA-binding GntR family transcriptional regulator